MTIHISNKLTLNILNVLSWLLFVGLSIDAGGFIVNAILVLYNPAVVKNLYHEMDLSDLFKHDHGQFFVVVLLLSIVAAMKAWLFYLIIKILNDKDINISQPFIEKVRRLILQLSFVSLLIGVFSKYAASYTRWLGRQGIQMPDTEFMQLGGAGVWLLMAVLLFIIAAIFKKGIEIQSENDLTI